MKELRFRSWIGLRPGQGPVPGRFQVRPGSGSETNEIIVFEKPATRWAGSGSNPTDPRVTKSVNQNRPVLPQFQAVSGQKPLTRLTDPLTPGRFRVGPRAKPARGQPALEGLTRSARTDSPRQDWSEQIPAARGGGGGAQGRRRRLLEEGRGGGQELGSRNSKNSPPMLNTLSSVSVWESRIQYLCDPQWFRDTASRGPTTIVAPESQFRTCPSDHGIQLAVGPQPLWLRNHNSGPAQRIMVKRLATSPHDPLACFCSALLRAGCYFICTALVQLFLAFEHCWLVFQLVSSFTTAIFLHLRGHLELLKILTDYCLRISSSSSSFTSSTINPSLSIIQLSQDPRSGFLLVTSRNPDYVRMSA
ncbi:hypothetical protein F511_06141 [Dorcoceras hygrometricum]|uniref:Uncharacterized protein n=1 Tax=Dorcoceras hygrometricum TaxID=472368 RepID=A0A2Z7AHX8_9LAMI|nr:hypothetical protein F511_06141 [Dorcoceras hygrometricum]